MIKTIKNIGLFFVLLFVFCVNSIYPHPAWGIVVDQQKQVFFSDLETVWKIDRQGNLSIFREGESDRHVHDLAVDAEGNIYGLDNSFNPQTQKFPRSIWKMTPSGEFTYLISPTDDLPPGESIWRDSGGNTYSVEPYNNEKKETKIIKKSPDGKATLLAGGKYGYLDGQKDNAEFTVITDMAFGKDNTIYVTNDDKVRKIDKSGTVTTIYREESPNKNQESLEPFSRLFGLTVDEQNNVFVADFYNNRLLKISSDGKVSPILNSEKDWSPIGVTANNDEIYVLEARPYSSEVHTGNRVVKIASDGKPTVIASMEEAVKPKDSSNKNDDSSSLETGNTSSSSEPSSQNNWLILLGVIGAGGAAFAAFIILVKRK
jgi:hypothetical protein